MTEYIKTQESTNKLDETLFLVNNEPVMKTALELLPLLEVREVNRIAYVVVTSDKGLAGSFNSSALRKAQNEIDEFGKDNVDIFCIEGLNIYIKYY